MNIDAKQELIKEYLKNERALYRDWYLEYKRDLTGIPGSEISFPSLDEIKDSFKQWREKNQEALYQLICVYWDYPSKRKTLHFQEKITLIVSLSEFLIQQTKIGIPGATPVATLLFLQGLDDFCDVKYPKN